MLANKENIENAITDIAKLEKKYPTKVLYKATRRYYERIYQKGKGVEAKAKTKAKKPMKTTGKKVKK